MNLIALRLNEMGLQLEGAGMPEIVAALGVAEREILRLQNLVDKGKESVWTGRRFYFAVLKKPADTPLAIVFNQILEALGQDTTGDEAKAMYQRFYPVSPLQSSERTP